QPSRSSDHSRASRVRSIRRIRLYINPCQRAVAGEPNMRKPGSLLLSFALIAAGGCEAAKSSNPLTPTVAGPIPGVTISAPKTLEPLGWKIAVDNQPVTLLAENAATTGVRPLSYIFEVATDSAFNNKVFMRD